MVLQKTAEFELSHPEDYAYSVLCALVDELKCTPKYMMYIKLAGIAAKYLWKVVRGRMAAKDWTTLVFDILSVVVEYYLKDMKNKFSSKIKKLQKKKKNSKNVERKLQSKKNTSLQIKVYYCGISLNITLPISDYLLSFILEVIFR